MRSSSRRTLSSVSPTSAKLNSPLVIFPSRPIINEKPKSSSSSLVVFFFCLFLLALMYWIMSHQVQMKLIQGENDGKFFFNQLGDNSKTPLISTPTKISQTLQPIQTTVTPTVKRKRYAYAITITKDGFFQDGAAVLAYSIMKYSWNASYDISFVAFVHPNVTTSRPGLQKLGFHVIEVPIPINRTAIKFEFLREKIEKNGCCGSSEMIKLTSYRLTQYERVIHLDADVIFLNPIDELFKLDYSLIYTTDPNMATFKGIDKMPVQGGFIIIKPSIEDYRRIIHTEMTTEFKKHHGWNSSHIGWFWGGMTVQGILPYYYNRITTPGRSKIVDRCYYNTMADTPECSVQTLDQLKSAHFTVCQKPWGCWKQIDNRLCRDLHGRWMDLRKEAELFYSLPSINTCVRGGPKNYARMNFENAHLPDSPDSPYYYLRQNVIPDDSPDRIEPLEESMYLTKNYY